MNVKHCISSMLCNKALQQDIEDDCENPMHDGIEEVAVIINYKDIKSIIRDADNKDIIRDLVLADGAVAYRVVNKRNNPFSGTNTAANINDLRNDVTKTVALFIPSDGAEAAKNILNPMLNGRFVIILANEWQHVNSDGVVDNKFPVYGLTRGLKLSSMQQTRYESNDYWLVELQEANVPDVAEFLIHTTATSEEVTTPSQVVADGGVLVDEDGNPFPESASVEVVAKTAEHDGSTFEFEATVTLAGETTTVYVIAIHLNPPTGGDSEFIVSKTTYTDDTCDYLSGLLDSVADEIDGY